MVGAFHNLYSRVLNCLFDTIQIGTFRISVFHKHAGTEVHNIQTMLFQSIYQTVYSPSRTASTREKGDYLRVFIVSLKVRLSLVESFKAAHSRAGFETMSQRTTAIFVGFVFSVMLHYNPFCVVQSYSRRVDSVCLGTLTTSTLKIPFPGFRRR